MNRKKSIRSRSSVLVREGVIENARARLQLTQQQLSARAGVSEGCIRSMERQKRVLPIKVQKVARALELKYERVVTDDFDPAISATPKPSNRRQLLSVSEIDDGCVEITVTFDVKADPFDRSRQAESLVAEMFSLLKCRGGFDPNRMIIREGSLIVAMRVSPRDARSIQWAFRKGNLASLKVIAVKLDERDLDALLEKQIAAIQQGNSAAVREFLEEYGPDVYQIVGKKLSRAAREGITEDDIVQMVWAKFFDSLIDGQSIATRADLISYLASIARFTLRNVLSNQRKKAATEGTYADIRQRITRQIKAYVKSNK